MKPLNRNEKIEALLAIKNGKAPAAVLPLIEVLLVESESIVKFLVIGSSKEIVLKKDEVEDYLKRFKEICPGRYVEVTQYTEEEWNGYLEKFERDY